MSKRVEGISPSELRKRWQEAIFFVPTVSPHQTSSSTNSHKTFSLCSSREHYSQMQHTNKFSVERLTQLGPIVLLLITQICNFFNLDFSLLTKFPRRCLQCRVNVASFSPANSSAPIAREGKRGRREKSFC